MSTARAPDLESVRDAVSAQPGLLVRSAGEGAVIEGVFQLSQDGLPFESFLIEIQLAEVPPVTQPQVFEIGGRIERNDAHHVNGDGSLCLGVPEEIWLLLGGQYDLARFLEEVVKPFLLGLACYLRGEPWPFGERAHGAAGICEFYGERFGTREPEHALNIIDLLLADAPKGHWTCPCGSGKVLRQCHRDGLNELRDQRIPIVMLQRSAHLIGDSIAGRDGIEDAELKRLCVKMQRILRRPQRRASID